MGGRFVGVGRRRERAEGEGGRDAREREGGDCNLYYPSTISVERIGGARITVITTDTRNNIMRDAFRRVYVRPARIRGDLPL